MKTMFGVAGAVMVVAAGGLWACGGGTPQRLAEGPPGARDPRQWPADDRSLCEGFIHWKSSPTLEVSETAGPESFRPNIRRIYKVIGDRDDRHQVLMCREIDTNLDGIKDVVRTFNEKGEPLHEEADTNYDGKMDNWINFANGRIEEEDLDTTLAAGRPNVWKFYIDGELSRIRRNTHCPSGKPDVWEIYFKNRLERIGNDETCDSHVDRWDRDTQLMAQEEAAQGVEIVDGGGPAPATGNGSAPMTVGTAGQVIDGSAPPADAGAKPRRNRR